jgi:hypothetical protein
MELERVEIICGHRHPIFSVDKTEKLISRRRLEDELIGIKKVFRNQNDRDWQSGFAASNAPLEWPFLAVATLFRFSAHHGSQFFKSISRKVR